MHVFPFHRRVHLQQTVNKSFFCRTVTFERRVFSLVRESDGPGWFGHGACTDGSTCSEPLKKIIFLPNSNFWKKSFLSGMRVWRSWLVRSWGLHWRVYLQWTVKKSFFCRIVTFERGVFSLVCESDCPDWFGQWLANIKSTPGTYMRDTAILGSITGDVTDFTVKCMAAEVYRAVRGVPLRIIYFSRRCQTWIEESWTTGNFPALRAYNTIRRRILGFRLGHGT